MNKKIVRLIAAGLLLALFAGLIPVLGPRLMVGAPAIPAMIVTVVVSIALALASFPVRRS